MVITSSNIIYQAFPVLAMLTLSMVTTSQTMYLINFLVAFFFSRANSIISNRMHYCTAYRKSHANLYYIEQNLHNNISIKTSNRTLDAQKEQIPYLQIQIQHQKGLLKELQQRMGGHGCPESPSALGSEFSCAWIVIQSFAAVVAQQERVQGLPPWLRGEGALARGAVVALSRSCRPGEGRGRRGAGPRPRPARRAGAPAVALPACAGRLGARAWRRVVGGAGRARPGTGGQARQRGDEVWGGGGNGARSTRLAAAAQGQG